MFIPRYSEVRVTFRIGTELLLFIRRRAKPFWESVELESDSYFSKETPLSFPDFSTTRETHRFSTVQHTTIEFFWDVCESWGLIDEEYNNLSVKPNYLHIETEYNPYDEGCSDSDGEEANSDSYDSGIDFYEPFEQDM